ncbi:condensation domain-containing protein [Cognatiyoonia sp. IB215446]|uniref:condensation domain-containing protein n=1 Tax=Cognatiyoonia sp. IB215446 TaxID=3097355 RepID=UPI002A133A75|nr:condensation domain-containing protein [Cognatiyoonia sp. IB215446]MDX8348119.1 condensation domain-containing protein [Cognatiyoonia sp. IB215446]
MITEAQDRLREIHAELADPSVLNLSYTLGLEGTLDVDALAWAFDRIAETFPSLGAVGGEELFGWEDFSDPNVQVGLTDAIVEVRRYRFDIDGDPLLVARCLTLSPSRHVLVIAIHHSAADGWSLSTIARALGRYYAALLQGQEAEIDTVLNPADTAPASEQRLVRERDELSGNLSNLNLSASQPLANSAGSEPLVRFTRSYLPNFAEAIESAAKKVKVTAFAAIAGTVARQVIEDLDRQEVLVGTTILNRHSSSDLLVDAPLYQGSLFRVARTYDWKDIGGQVAAASSRMLPYDEQLEIAGAVMQSDAPVTPPLFVFADTHPLSALTLEGITVRFLDSSDKEDQPLPAIRMADIVFFWRSGAGGATGNLIVPASLSPIGKRLIGKIDDALKALAGNTFAGPTVVKPWAPGLVARDAPLVDGLSPVGRIAI